MFVFFCLFSFHWTLFHTHTVSIKWYFWSNNNQDWQTFCYCSGRAGREGPGKCFRLYPESEFEKLEDSTKPEIKRCNLSNVILQLKALGVDDIIGFDFLEKPSRWIFRFVFTVPLIWCTILVLHVLLVADDCRLVTIIKILT